MEERAVEPWGSGLVVAICSDQGASLTISKAFRPHLEAPLEYEI